MLLLPLFLCGVMFCGTLSAQDDYTIRTGYVGFLDQSNAFAFKDGMNTFSLGTTHGCQFNGNVFVGAGFSFLWNKNAFVMPIYTSFRYNFTEKRTLPFGQVRLGYYIGEGSGQYADADLSNVSLRFAFEW